MKCPHCDEEIAGIACPECYEESPEGADFCMKCGAALAAPDTGGEEGDEFDLDSRVLCPDGTCTGIIVDGKCSECGKPYPPKAGSKDENAEVAEAEAEEKVEEEAKEGAGGDV